MLENNDNKLFQQILHLFKRNNVLDVKELFLMKFHQLLEYLRDIVFHIIQGSFSSLLHHKFLSLLINSDFNVLFHWRLQNRSLFLLCHPSTSKYLFQHFVDFLLSLQHHLKANLEYPWHRAFAYYSPQIRKPKLASSILPLQDFHILHQ